MCVRVYTYTYTNVYYNLCICAYLAYISHLRIGFFSKHTRMYRHTLLYTFGEFFFSVHYCTIFFFLRTAGTRFTTPGARFRSPAGPGALYRWIYNFALRRRLTRETSRTHTDDRRFVITRPRVFVPEPLSTVPSDARGDSQGRRPHTRHSCGPSYLAYLYLPTYPTTHVPACLHVFVVPVLRDVPYGPGVGFVHGICLLGLVIRAARRVSHRFSAVISTPARAYLCDAYTLIQRLSRNVNFLSRNTNFWTRVHAIITCETRQHWLACNIRVYHMCVCVCVFCECVCGRRQDSGGAANVGALCRLVNASRDVTG